MEDISSNQGFEYLDNLIHSDVKKIELESDVTLDSSAIKIDVDDLVIDGNNHTIDANGKSQIFHVTGKNIVLKNIVFKNAYSKVSGAAVSNFRNELTLIDCTFINNISFKGDGGAICNWGGFLTVDGCVFIDNSAKNGGAIYNGNSMEIINCKFRNNNSRRMGLSIFNKSGSSLTLKNSNFERDESSAFEDNYLNNEIFNRGIVNIENSEKELFKNLIRYGFLHIISNDSKSFRHLRNLINLSGNEINLDSDIEFNEDDEEIVINGDDLVIDGNGHTIDALGKSSIFTFNSKNITLKNIDFRNANSKQGGLLVNRNSSINFVNCHFENNISENGGAINNEGILTMDNCSFDRNVSKNDYGGAINNNGKLKVVKCNFNNNISRNAGGAINNFNHADLEECDFKSNIAEKGGAINNMSSGLLNVLKCNFEKNNAFKQGSIIFNDNYLDIKNSEFSDNISNKECHAIYHKGDEDSELLIENCNFSHFLSDNNLIYLKEGFCRIYFSNFDVNDDFYCIHNQNANLRFEKSNFINFNDKAIFNEGILNIRKEKKIENRIMSGVNGQLNHIGERIPDGWKGFAYLDNLIHSNSKHITLNQDILMHFSEQDFYESGIEVDVDGLVIDGNYHTIDANNFSRIFIISANDVVLKNIKFKNGKYFKSKFDGENAGGGAIYALPESSVEINQCIFLENKSRKSAGAILNKSKYLKIENIRFENNHARNKGGALFNENSAIEMNKCDFIKNFSGCSGGIYNENSQFYANKVIFNSNSANKCGAIFNQDSFVRLDGCKFIKNSSKDCAGAVFNYKNFSEVNDCEFIENNSIVQGGAIFNEFGNMTLDNCKFSKNSSQESGGGIFNINGCFNLSKCNFNDNSALNRGGSAENNFNSKMYFADCSFSKNSARDGGAISNMKKCNLSLKSCDFENNNALENGGGIYNWYGFANIEGSNFRANESEYAGAIDNYLGWVNVKKSKFNDNIVKKHGGAIFNGGMLESLEDCIFENNNSLLKGGAIYFTKSSSGNISYSKFDSNRANGNGGLGGAIYNNSFFNGKEEFSLDLIGCDFVNNCANDDGAAIFNKGHLNLNKCDFKDNKTNNWGLTLKNEGENVETSMRNTNFDDEIY